MYSPGDIVFACHPTRSFASRERVGKLEYKITGPLRILELLHGGLYSLEHCLHPKRPDKKHASDLMPYPPMLVPFKPVDGADTRYGQLYCPIGKHPFKDTGLKGFTPLAPFQVANLFVDIRDFKDFRRPTLSELNDKLDPYPWRNDDERCRFMTDGPPFNPPVMYNGLPPSPPTPAPQSSSPPTITKLAPCIITSTDKLFFIAYALGKATRKWRLVRVAFNESITLYPSALQDSHFLVEFYVLHPADVRFNATNQRYWLQYCTRNGISNSHLDAHLITHTWMSVKGCWLVFAWLKEFPPKIYRGGGLFIGKTNKFIVSEMPYIGIVATINFSSKTFGSCEEHEIYFSILLPRPT